MTDVQSSFWRGHVRLGVAATTVCAATGAVYALSTTSEKHRPVLLLLALLILLATPMVLTTRVMAVLTGPGREPWLYAWSAVNLATVTGSCLLDGGGRSPLAMLFLASLVYTASGFRRGGVVVMGVATVVSYLATCLQGGPGTWETVMVCTSLVLIAATCALTAGRLRDSLLQQEGLAKQLRLQASLDGLTGCLNHSAFVERLSQEVGLAHRDRRKLGLVMLDLDDFKRANDTFGHVAADELLTAIGAGLRAAVRYQDVVGRVGGDEFAILAPDTDDVETHALADRVRADLVTVGATMAVGTSVGVSVLHAGDDARELRQRADQALYAAKRTRQPESISLDL